MRNYSILVLVIFLILTGCSIKPIDLEIKEETSSVNIASEEVAKELVLKMVDEAPTVLFSGGESNSWNYLLSSTDRPKDMNAVEVEVAEQLTPAVYVDILNPEEKRAVYYQVIINKVYWGGLSKNADLLISSFVEYTAGAKIILFFSERADIAFKTANGSEYQETVWLSGKSLFVVEYKGTEFVMDPSFSDLAIEMYDRGLQNNTGDAVIYNGITIVKKNAFESFLALKDEYQTGKWLKHHSWEMEEGPPKEAEAANEALKVKVIKSE